MTDEHPLRVAVAELIGTALLLAAVVGSGIMAERLSPTNPGVALLANAIATGAALYALIVTFGAVSGAHFNPIVTLAAAVTRELPWARVWGHLGAQLVGAIVGVWIAHGMFGLAILQQATHVRSGGAQVFSEVVATFGLVLVIGATSRRRPETTPAAVALYITAGYWFTASSSFANPAVSIARALTDTVAGIRAVDVGPYIGAQLVGGALAVAVVTGLFPRRAAH